MQRKQPQIQLPPDASGGISDKVAGFLLLLQCVLVGVSMAKLPDNIAMHFTLSGKANGWGSKYLLLLIPLISGVLFVVMGLLMRVPHLFNYLVAITAENAERQYRIAINMLRQLRLTTTTMFCFVTVLLIVSANGTQPAWGVWALPLTVALMLVPIVTGVVRSLKAK